MLRSSIDLGRWRVNGTGHGRHASCGIGCHNLGRRVYQMHTTRQLPRFVAARALSDAASPATGGVGPHPIRPMAHLAPHPAPYRRIFASIHSRCVHRIHIDSSHGERLPSLIPSVRCAPGARIDGRRYQPWPGSVLTRGTTCIAPRFGDEPRSRPTSLAVPTAGEWTSVRSSAAHRSPTRTTTSSERTGPLLYRSPEARSMNTSIGMLPSNEVMTESSSIDHVCHAPLTPEMPFRGGVSFRKNT